MFARYPVLYKNSKYNLEILNIKGFKNYGYNGLYNGLNRPRYLLGRRTRRDKIIANFEWY